MPPPWPRFGLPVVLRTIRGKLAALVVFSVLIAMGLAVWGMLLAPRLALQSARPLVEAGGMAVTDAFREALLADETVLLNMTPAHSPSRAQPGGGQAGDGGCATNL